MLKRATFLEFAHALLDDIATILWMTFVTVLAITVLIVTFVIDMSKIAVSAILAMAILIELTNRISHFHFISEVFLILGLFNILTVLDGDEMNIR